jgi:hypothetical protein
MSNIWADTFSAIREPFFEEKKEKEELQLFSSLLLYQLLKNQLTNLML